MKTWILIGVLIISLAVFGVGLYYFIETINIGTGSGYDMLKRPREIILIVSTLLILGGLISAVYCASLFQKAENR